ncbi:PREDICTED: dolichyl-diphosphooligosaccharide--protein glycosyltransferase subunit DAD1 [Pygoscelis adeliae]|uniref:dolichyl-diphosphooligosaccharide--protein glycosyltransferase subunit DAD1 n=1 Tax=Pygoscelis adeliae TaxID=9238 RepID=UPI0004F4E76E|nr:PREDICTED: dolichyl-diphosphooligosaccharide--protein glycosyltransferase subunit DAD1 [Pygoscelis adeliae]
MENIGISPFLFCLRIQINPQNKGEFQGISPERAFADFLFANTILHLVVINFVG